MSIATSGTVNAGVMDRAQSTGDPLSFGGLGTGADTNAITIGGWFISKENLGASLHKTLFAFRNGTGGSRVFLAVVQVAGARRLRLTIQDDVASSANHYANPFQDSEGNDILAPVMAVDKLWWASVVIDGRNSALAPNTVEYWIYSPPAASGGEDYPLTKLTFGKSGAENNNFILNTYQFCLGGWQGDTSATPSDYAHKCQFVDWYYYGGYINDPNFFTAITTGGTSVGEILPSLPSADYRHWSCRETATPWLDTWRSGDNLATQGLVGVAAAFSGVKTFPASFTLVHDARISRGANANTDFASATTLIVGMTVANTTANRILERWYAPYTIPSSALFAPHLCSLTHNASASGVSAEPLIMQNILRPWHENDGEFGGVTYNSWEPILGSGWTTGGATGAGDSDPTTYAVGNIPTTTGNWTIEPTGFTSYLQNYLPSATGVSFMIRRLSESGTVSTCTSHSRTGTVPPTLEVGWSISFALNNILVNSLRNNRWLPKLPSMPSIGE